MNPLPDQSASASRTYTIYVCAVVPVVVAPVEGEPAFDEDRDG